MSPSLHLRQRPFLCTLLLLGSLLLSAQTDSARIDDGVEFQEQLIEDFIANTGDESDEFEFNAAFTVLGAYRRRPLDLNRATYEDLAETLLLSPIQISQLLDYRLRMNGLLSIYELQVIPSFDLESIRRLVPYVRVGGDLDDIKIPFARMLAEGERELFTRWQRNLETARGYTLGPEDGTNYYLGSPDRLYLRFRQRYSNKLSFGFTAEKDPGEAFFSANNARRGFDYYSAHFFLSGINRHVKAVALGDFNVSFGQGLILYTGFGFGKSIQSTNVGRGGPVLRPYTSVSEFNFMRGAATTLALGEKLELTVFGSRRGRTANLVSVQDTTELDPEQLLGVTSLNLTGLNRTPSEVEDRNAVVQTSYGGSLRLRASQRLQLGLNFLGEHLSRPLEIRDQVYNRFFFRGTDLQNASLDYRYRLRNFTFFGEVAASDNGATAQLHGLMLGLDRYVDLSAVYRRYERDYQALNANPFAEGSGARNEEGLYFGLEMRPGRHWRINAYYDLFRFPYFRFNVDGPDQGHEYRFRLTYWEKRKLEAYLELRSETKGIGGQGDLFPTLEAVIPQTRFQGRLHFGYNISPTLEWRSRLDAGFTDDEREGRRTGMMIYQDLHWRPRGPWSISTRFALFDTDEFDVRFYQYENGLLYNARVVPYYGRGTRTFFLFRYKGIRRLTLEGRIAQTFFNDGTTVGTGLEATGLPRRTEVGGQVIWRF
ncbi:helix-hairpin-helix domain-containing protein [Neolewinella lacunae]|uniref:Helix-hairpin-helix domain-containing protein n=1 Tax=Neolewinella lacunae TaxID=1517758 RepID=A0A923PJH3_9BACT|nr:helix-hairpin-helix domain-containing protein [Neolewinella lacunae]MBC6992866.1 helix-hairpin-helix domain-containing protein [Neolewinella lacunae]MDN3633770.1 helix-hairpin-helix domain-containing protein [Neolewinella lacunae]